MRKIICLLLIIIFSTHTLACTNDSKINADNSSIKTEHILTFDAPENLFDTVQGGTFDGEYYYIAFVNSYLPYETAIIVKYDKDGNEVKRSEVLPLDHANSITMLENGNLMVAHCQSPDEHYYRYSIIDKDSFEIIETKDLNEPFMSIAYCKETKCFVSGEWNGDKMNVYGENLNLLYSFNVNFRDSFPQSYFCTKDVIYAIRCFNDGSFHNYIYAYSYEGKTLLEYKLNIPRLTEAEAISVVDNEVYVICGDYGNCVVYKVSNLIENINK